jgi:RNA polymerase sigma-70 factor (ECF subfamily)
VVDGAAALVWAQAGEPRVVFGLTFAAGRITAIDLLADPELLRELEIELVDG